LKQIFKTLLITQRIHKWETNIDVTIGTNAHETRQKKSAKVHVVTLVQFFAFLFLILVLLILFPLHFQEFAFLKHLQLLLNVAFLNYFFLKVLQLLLNLSLIYLQKTQIIKFFFSNEFAKKWGECFAEYFHTQTNTLQLPAVFALVQK